MAITVKTFRIQDDAAEQNLNSYLQNRSIQHMAASYDNGVWHVLIATDQGRPQNRPEKNPREQNKNDMGRDRTKKPQQASEPRPERPDPSKPVNVSPEDMPLYDAIRRWRNARAKEAGIKPFLLFSNTTLEELVKAKPQSTESLRPLLKDMDDEAFEKYKNELTGFLTGASATSESATV